MQEYVTCVAWTVILLEYKKSDGYIYQPGAYLVGFPLTTRSSSK